MNKTYCILNYTRIKPRSRPPQKKFRIFYAPRFFSSQNRKNKCANYASKYGNFIYNKTECYYLKLCFISSCAKKNSELT